MKAGAAGVPRPTAVFCTAVSRACRQSRLLSVRMLEIAPRLQDYQTPYPTIFATRSPSVMHFSPSVNPFLYHRFTHSDRLASFVVQYDQSRIKHPTNSASLRLPTKHHDARSSGRKTIGKFHVQ